MDYKIKKDIQLIRDFFELTQENLARELGVERVRIARIESGLNYPREEFLDLLYNYCFNKGLKLNAQKEAFYKEELLANHILLTHASRSELVGEIKSDYGKANNDFGKGFYCGESYEKSASFICRSNNSSIYFLDFCPTGLNKVVFSANQEWMLAIAYFRGRLDEYKDSEVVLKIINKIKNADYIIAPITDNRMFSIIDEFINGYITDEQCKHCLAATPLGLQYVFLTEKAVKNIKILEKCYISSSERNYYAKKQMDFQKQGFDKTKLARIEYKGKGKYIEEIFK